MSIQVKKYADPIRTVMFMPVCLYCEKQETFWAKCTYWLAVLACDEHKGLAIRDANAWHHNNGKVRWSDYTKDALFEQSDILHSPITVKRTNGAIETNWSIIKPDYIDNQGFIHCISNIWTIGVEQVDTRISKCIPVVDLKLSLPEDKHILVDALIDRLTAGFYKSDADAYTRAMADSEIVENPTPVISSRNKPVIDNIYHPNYGFGRIFEPSRQQVINDQPTNPTRVN